MEDGVNPGLEHPGGRLSGSQRCGERNDHCGAFEVEKRVELLTEGQPFLRKSPDVAVFTGDLSDVASLRPALAAYGLEGVERL